MGEYYQERLDGFDHLDDSVYGGNMNQQEFYDAEFEVAECMPRFILPDVKGIEARIGGEEIILCRNNVMIYDFDILVDEENGITYDFEWMSHIYIHRGEGKPPYWHVKPEDEDEQEQWNDLAKRLIDIDCDYRTGIPKELDFEQFYDFTRGCEPMSDIIEQIINEAEDGTESL